MTKAAYETTPSRAVWDWNGGRFEIGTTGGFRSVYPGGFIGIRISAETTDMTEPIAPELQGILDAVCYAP